jgi:ribosomal protein L12E/L44/L45/RPP1/RPP2
MKWKTTAIAGVVLLVFGFLLGFIPESQRASELVTQLDGARLENKLREIRELAALSYLDSSKKNYASAASSSERMFGVANEVAKNTKDEALRGSLTGLLTFHDTVQNKLSAGDASVSDQLQQVVKKTQAELKR